MVIINNSLYFLGFAMYQALYKQFIDISFFHFGTQAETSGLFIVSYLPYHSSINFVRTETLCSSQLYAQYSHYIRHKVGTQ